MEHYFLHTLPNRAAAMVGTLALHGAVAAWALAPSPPVVIPQQQVIEIAMVAPSPVVEEQEQAQPEPEPAPTAPPKPDGIRKVEKKVERKPEPPKQKVEKRQAAAPQPPTSGPQMQQAKAERAAITEPQYNAAYLRNPPPEYPYAARRRGAQGKVLLEVEVTRDGLAREVKIARTSGSKLLDEAARDAVRQWRFIPARRGSEVLEARVIVPVEFKLN